MGIKKAFTAAILLVALFAAPYAKAGDFLAGAATADITPDVEKWKVNSIGYFSKKEMTSVHDKVYCKALTVSDGTSRAALITCDLMGTPPVLRDKVLEGVAGLGYDDNNLMMACSHTHSGSGNMMPNLIARIGFGAYNEEITQWTADRIIDAVKKAHNSMKPAELYLAERKLHGVTRNRRDPAGSYDYDTRRFTEAYDPDNPKNTVDPALTVIRVDEKGGETMAVLFHFATHGTVLGPEVTYLSADWMGVSQRVIEEGMPGVTAMYMNGAQGDQAPAMDADDPSNDLDIMEEIGSKVGEAVLDVVGHAEKVKSTPVRTVMERRQVPPGNSLMGTWVPRALVKHYFSELPLQSVRLGDVVFMALPLEAVTEVGIVMKEGARGMGVEHPIVVGLANDHLLYAATPDDFEEGGYEVDNTALGETEAAVLIGEQMLLVDDLMSAQ